MQYDKLPGNVGPLDDLETDLAANLLQCLLKQRPLVAAVSIKLAQKRIFGEHRPHQRDAPIAVLNIGGVNDGQQQQALSIYRDMALLAFNLLAGVIPMCVNRRPPFSALLTLWLSMMAAEGMALRAANSRHFT